MISLVSYLDKPIIEQFQINVYAEAKISNPNDIDETKYYLQSSVHLSLLPKPQPTRTMRVNPVSGGLLFWGSCCQQDDLIPLGRARRTMRAMFHARDAELHQLLAEETVKSRAEPSWAELDHHAEQSEICHWGLWEAAASMSLLLFKCNWEAL